VNTFPEPIDLNEAINLAHEIPVLHVTEMSSQIIYPAHPRHLLFVLPFETFARDPNAFSGGFDSLAAVENHSIPLDKFMEMAKLQQKFVIFVFFLDRLDPRDAVQIRFSDAAKRRSEPLGEKRYAISGDWPVLIELFSIDEEVSSECSLYVNIFKRSPKSTFFSRTQCIGYHRLK